VSERRIVQAREAFSGDVKGTPVNVGVGDLFWSDDPFLKGREHLFSALRVRDSGFRPSSPPEPPPAPKVEETASAEPNQPRRVGRPRTEKES
jgi:hypothetical protein